MNTKTNTPADAFSLACLGVCLLSSLTLFVYQVAVYTTLLG
jgi:hypothetical protein